MDDSPEKALPEPYGSNSTKAISSQSVANPPVSLYDANIASMEGVKSDYNPDDASGFIRLQALRLRARARFQGTPDSGPKLNLNRE
ncbi:MAG: hypothetical protein LR015_05425 [Verrucomicrobia bacterium]|nr:hypothetical protein [Verrucomicrobiota bacterium]